ncbi:hypothetical protein CAPTEDRAFT_199547 [Capitella teleta]|uniref:Uncharacterized protein n=1 Tax=Capitella teleta TaxID=283909 RepID=R7UNQ5_CAPTE|nr:hypothetical protein CAPTEDRAFT_199547 [Capitella teleta]|eukprot:ELU07738.1 hypothetical protein CAPTEDRAFT_199547 [Capitella teleta]
MDDVCSIVKTERGRRIASRDLELGLHRIYTEDGLAVLNKMDIIQHAHLQEEHALPSIATRKNIRFNDEAHNSNISGTVSIDACINNVLSRGLLYSYVEYPTMFLSSQCAVHMSKQAFADSHLAEKEPHPGLAAFKWSRERSSRTQAMSYIMDK